MNIDFKNIIKISFNNKQWNSNGTFYQNGVKMNLNILMDFVKYLKNVNSNDSMEKVYIKDFINLIEGEKENNTLKFIDKIFIKLTISKHLYIYLNKYINTKNFTKNNTFIKFI